jgi:hypothetical protein
MALFHKRTMTNDVCNEKSALIYTSVLKRTHCIVLTAKNFASDGVVDRSCLIHTVFKYLNF